MGKSLVPPVPGKRPFSTYAIGLRLVWAISYPQNDSRHIVSVVPALCLMEAAAQRQVGGGGGRGLRIAPGEDGVGRPRGHPATV